MDQASIDYHNLPKFVIGGINGATGTIGLVKVYDYTEDGKIVPNSWRVAVWDTLEEAAVQYEKDKEHLSDWLMPINLDDLHRTYAKYLVDTGSICVEYHGEKASPSEELYRLANHIDSARGGMPDDWQEWATEISMQIRTLSTHTRAAEEEQAKNTDVLGIKQPDEGQL